MSCSMMSCHGYVLFHDDCSCVSVLVIVFQFPILTPIFHLPLYFVLDYPFSLSPILSPILTICFTLFQEPLLMHLGDFS